jgi:hypothetical protein
MSIDERSEPPESEAGDDTGHTAGDTTGNPAEAEAVARIVEALTRRFPMLSAEVVRQRVQQSHAHFGTAPIRDFIPLLVEREVRRDLTAEAG